MARPSSAWAAAARGALAGAAGTVLMDLFWYGMRRLRGGAEPPSGPPGPASGYWRTAPRDGDDAESWEARVEGEAEEWRLAPAPARVGKRFYEGVTQLTLEARFARITGSLVHWAYGMWWGGLFGLASATRTRKRPAWGPLLGATVWATSYLLLPVTGLYRPIWKYPLTAIAPDLAAHLIYGTGTAVVFSLMSVDSD